MKRVVRPELLDELPPEDARARHSRQDLRRINACMRNPAIIAAALRETMLPGKTVRILELGAGDGHGLLSVARLLPKEGPSVHATLLDRVAVLDQAVAADFKALNWTVEAVVADVKTWLEGKDEPLEIVVANLFLHHFSNEQLTVLFRAVQRRARLLIAVEPRRGGWPLLASRGLRWIGCNEVTRHDAVVSVRAGFAGKELSALWPAASGWQLTERSAGPFSHLFIARSSRGDEAQAFRFPAT